jgi:hypothetical protein
LLKALALENLHVFPGGRFYKAGEKIKARKNNGIRINIPFRLIKPKRINSGQRQMPKQCELKAGRAAIASAAKAGFQLVFWLDFLVPFLSRKKEQRSLAPLSLLSSQTMISSNLSEQIPSA